MSLAEAERASSLRRWRANWRRAAEEGGEATIAARARELLGKLEGNGFTWWWSGNSSGARRRC